MPFFILIQILWLCIFWKTFHDVTWWSISKQFDNFFKKVFDKLKISGRRAMLKQPDTTFQRKENRRGRFSFMTAVDIEWKCCFTYFNLKRGCLRKTEKYSLRRWADIYFPFSLPSSTYSTGPTTSIRYSHCPSYRSPLKLNPQNFTQILILVG